LRDQEKNINILTMSGIEKDSYRNLPGMPTAAKDYSGEKQ